MKRKLKIKIIGLTDISKYLGPFKFSSSMIEAKDTVGITTGLAWTQAGGDILFIEVAIMPGKGGLTLNRAFGRRHERVLSGSFIIHPTALETVWT